MATNHYSAIVWIYMQLCDKFHISYTIVDTHAFPDEENQVRIFRTAPNAKRRIILSWLHNQLLQKSFITDKKLWTFVKKIQELLIPAIQEKNSTSSLITFEYPKDPFGLDKIPEITDEMIEAEVILGAKKMEQVITPTVSIPSNPDAQYEATQHYRRVSSE